MFRRQPTPTDELTLSEESAALVEAFLPAIAGLSMLHQDMLDRGLPREVADEFVLYIVRKLV